MAQGLGTIGAEGSRVTIESTCKDSGGVRMRGCECAVTRRRRCCLKVLCIKKLSYLTKRLVFGVENHGSDDWLIQSMRLGCRRYSFSVKGRPLDFNPLSAGLQAHCTPHHHCATVIFLIVSGSRIHCLLSELTPGPRALVERFEQIYQRPQQPHVSPAAA